MKKQKLMRINLIMQITDYKMMRSKMDRLLFKRKVKMMVIKNKPILILISPSSILSRMIKNHKLTVSQLTPLRMNNLTNSFPKNNQK